VRQLGHFMILHTIFAKEDLVEHNFMDDISKATISTSHEFARALLELPEGNIVFSELIDKGVTHETVLSGMPHVRPFGTIRQDVEDGGVTILDMGNKMKTGNKADMLAFWVIKDVTSLKYFYENILQGAIQAQIDHNHPSELVDITQEEIVEATEKIKFGLKKLGWTVHGESR
jgi:hypothetical protein